MPHARPMECPACGHERIARRRQRLQADPLTLRVGTTEWACQLCDYTWSRPAAAPRPVWEPE